MVSYLEKDFRFVMEVGVSYCEEGVGMRVI